MRRWLHSNQGVGVVLALAFGLLASYLWASPWVHRVMRDGFTLGFFPLLGAFSMLACALLLIIDPFRKQVPETFSDAHWTDVPIALALLAGIFAYFHLSLRIGFVLASPIFLFVLMVIFGARPLRHVALVAIILPIFIYLLFGLLGIRLPRGILPFGF